MEAWPSGETVTLIRYGPRMPRQPPVRAATKKSDKFSFKFRRRSKSAPRHAKPRDPSPEVREIVYTANGEKITNEDSPLRNSDLVQLVGFTTYNSTLADDGAHHHSLDSQPPPPRQLATQCRAVSVPGASSTLSRTSKDIKMERERLRQERLKQWGPRRQELEVAKLAEERAKFFDEARERFHNTNSDLFASFLAEQEQRFLGRRAAAFRGDVVPPASSQSQLGRAEERTEAVEETGARIIPIAISSQPASPVSAPPPPPPPAEERKEVERVIPVLLETSSSSSSSSSTSSTPVRAPALPALMGDLRIGDSLLRQGRASFHHPSFANHFGFSRLLAPGEPSSLLASFPGFPSFGHFPSFSPGAEEGLSPRVGEAKVALSKSKSSGEYGEKTEPFRYSGPPSSEPLDPYGDSEEEESEEELDSVSVVADRAGCRDRLSGTGSTHSGGSGSTHSADSGIPEEEPRLRVKYSESVPKPRRPESAVPSEYSVVSDSSSCEGSEDKAGPYSERTPVREVVSEVVREASDESEEAGREEERQERLRRAHAIATELLDTEKHYVAILHLIDQVFHSRVDRDNKTLGLNGDTLTTIFSNIKSIYKFHAEFLLPQLETRMTQWGDGPEFQRIGDIMVRNAPFLKMYTEYVKNFDTAMTAIGALYSKNRQFQAIMDEIHAMPECRSLTLQHHMLSPIQRIPRYELLLKEYIQKLPDNSPDTQDSQSALIQVSQAAAHANDSMKRIDQFKKLLEVQESIGGGIDLVSPTREVLKEGRMVKISARTGDHQERYLFLLSDLLLLCSPRKSMMAGPQFGLRARFEVDNMQVLEGDNLVTANTFYIRDEHKSVELYTSTREEKEQWLEQLFLAVKSLYTRKSSLRVGREILRPLDSEIGKRPPHMQRVETVARCTDCATHFSILRHKHNCRFCGAVFCGKCTEGRQPVPWEENRKARVCRACLQVLTSSVPIAPVPELPVRPRGLLEVPANHPAAVHSGWLVLRPTGSKAATTKRFFLLLPDYVLYSFRSPADTSALTATPLPGSTVLTGPGLKGDSGCAEKDREKVVKVVHGASRRTYYFAGTSATEMERWAELMAQAARAEPLPQPEPGSDSQSTSSTEFDNS